MIMACAAPPLQFLQAVHAMKHRSVEFFREPNFAAHCRVAQRGERDPDQMRQQALKAFGQAASVGSRPSGAKCLVMCNAANGKP
jgi:hypothetical protein